MNRQLPSAYLLIFCALSPGCSEKDGASSKASLDEFPPNATLAQQNVVLAVNGWKFGGGLTSDKGNGLEIVPASWVASGVVVSEDGTLITNYHVAARAVEIEATFDHMADIGGAKYAVPFIKVYDRDNDIAILQIDGAANFKNARLGNSDDVQPRDTVLAVGNPSGLGLNITEGSVSQIRKDQGSGKPLRLIHTAATMSGSSGGSLYKGSDVIGIHHAGIGETEFGFAVPINSVKPLLDNPDYDRKLMLTNVFDPEFDAWKDRMTQVDATTASVPAAPRKGVNGTWAAKFALMPQTDYVFMLQTGKNVDLDLWLWHGKQRIGNSFTRSPQYEALAYSNTGLASVSAQIEVHSAQTIPTKFGLVVYKVDW